MSKIDEWLAECPFLNGEEVRIKRTGEIGRVAYRYYNGFCLVAIPGKKCEGGILSNSSTFRWEELESVGNAQ